MNDSPLAPAVAAQVMRGVWAISGTGWGYTVSTVIAAETMPVLYAQAFIEGPIHGVQLVDRAGTIYARTFTWNPT